jgi:ABC-type glycerol-3-phosphate transport system substrate-binding protein
MSRSGDRHRVTRRHFLTASGAVTVLPAVAALLAACGPNQPAAPAQPTAAQPTQAAQSATSSGAPAATAAPSQAGGEVRVWFPWDDRAKYFIDGQAKAQPNLKMKFEVGEFDSNTKTMAVLAAGNPPDMSYLGRWQTCDLAVRNAIYALDDRVKNASSWKWDDVWSRLQKDSTSWGKIWIVPYATDTRALFYNEDLMTKSGLDPTKPPTTWTDLLDQSVKATKKNSAGQLEQLGFTPTFGNPPTFLLFYSMLWLLDSDIVNADKTKVTMLDHGTEALTIVKDFMDKLGGYEQASAFTKGLTLAQGIDAFSANKVVFAMNGAWQLATYAQYSPDLKYGMIPGPTYAPHQEHLNYDGGGGWFYFKKGKNVDGAWQLTDFLMGHDFYVTWFDQLDFLPVLQTAAKDWSAKKKAREVFVATANTVHWIPIVVGTLDMLNFIQTMWDDVMFGKATMDEALKKAADGVQAILDKHNSYPAPQG